MDPISFGDTLTAAKASPRSSHSTASPTTTLLTAPLDSGRHVLMGAGFIGCIVLEALAARGVDLVVVEMAERTLPRMECTQESVQ